MTFIFHSLILFITSLYLLRFLSYLVSSSTFIFKFISHCFVLSDTISSIWSALVVERMKSFSWEDIGQEYSSAVLRSSNALPVL